MEATDSDSPPTTCLPSLICLPSMIYLRSTAFPISINLGLPICLLQKISDLPQAMSVIVVERRRLRHRCPSSSSSSFTIQASIATFDAVEGIAILGRGAISVAFTAPASARSATSQGRRPRHPHSRYLLSRYTHRQGSRLRRERGKHPPESSAWRISRVRT